MLKSYEDFERKIIINNVPLTYLPMIVISIQSVFIPVRFDSVAALSEINNDVDNCNKQHCMVNLCEAQQR